MNHVVKEKLKFVNSHYRMLIMLLRVVLLGVLQLVMLIMLYVYKTVIPIVILRFHF